MNSPISIIGTAQLNPATGAVREGAPAAGTAAQYDDVVDSVSAIPILEWAEAEAYAVTIHGGSPGSSAAFHLSF